MAKKENRVLSDRLSKNERIQEHLRANGFRITSQRKLLLDIILEDEYSSCKEIYYKAVKKDSSVGIATVYRMINTLEELGVINRNKLYNLEYDDLPTSTEEEILYIDENTDKTITLKKGDWFDGLKRALREKGMQDLDQLSIVIKNQKQLQENTYDEHVCKGCHCTKTNCKYHCKNLNCKKTKDLEDSKGLKDSMDLKDSRVVNDLKGLKDSRVVKDLKGLKDSKGLMDLKGLKGLKI